MKIRDVQGIHVMIERDSGELDRVHRSQIKGSIQKDAVIQENIRQSENEVVSYTVIGLAKDKSECVGGQCPIN